MLRKKTACPPLNIEIVFPADTNFKTLKIEEETDLKLELMVVIGSDSPLFEPVYPQLAQRVGKCLSPNRLIRPEWRVNIVNLSLLESTGWPQVGPDGDF